MSRFVWALLAVLLVAASCSSDDLSAPVSSGDDGSASAVADPVVTFCERFDAFAEFSDQDQEPTEELIVESLRLQADVDEVVPGELGREWQTLNDWFQPMIDVLERDGYGPVTDETFIAAFGDLEASNDASERTQAAYEAIYAWQDASCPISQNDQAFCSQWRPYELLINSDPDVDAELAAAVLAMEAGLQAVVPEGLEADLAASIDWNARFIDWYQRNGYRELGDEDFYEVFDGDEPLADEVLEAREGAFPNIEAWAASNCSGATPSTTPLPVQFCAAWDQFLALTADNAELDKSQFDQTREIVDRASADVPAAVADDWSAIADFVDRYGDVLVSVEFQEERITDNMLEQAFGSVDAYEQAGAARDAAGSSIADWSLEGCGDFCARWPDMNRVTAEVGNERLQWVVEDPQNGRPRLEEHLGTLAILDQLAPAEVGDSWEVIYEAYRDWVNRWEQAEFDAATFESTMESGAVEWVRTMPHLSTAMDFGSDDDFYVRILEAWQGGASEVPDWVYKEWVGDFGPDRLDEIREELEARDTGFVDIINLFERDELPWWLRELAERSPAHLTAPLMNEVQSWVDANCAEATGRPGTLRVRYPRVEGRAGGSVILALLPLGGSYEDLADVPSMVAAWCDGVGRDPWGVWLEEYEGGVEEVHSESDFFRAEWWSDDHVCDFRHDLGPASIDAASYTLVGGITWGGLGDPAEGIDLVSCLAVNIAIDSDTTVDLPPFEPCDVRIGGGEPDPWRYSPVVNPSTPGAGTLRIELETMLTPPPFEERYGSLTVMVLPAGSTLNEVGRKQVWPAGAINTELVARRHADEMARHGSMLLPVATLPPSGHPIRLDPDWLAEGPPDDRLPFTTLAPGSYDVYVQVEVHMEEEREHPPQLCGRTEVLINGDTVIALPELGECP